MFRHGGEASAGAMSASQELSSSEQLLIQRQHQAVNFTNTNFLTTFYLFIYLFGLEVL